MGINKQQPHLVASSIRPSSYLTVGWVGRWPQREHNNLTVFQFTINALQAILTLNSIIFYYLAREMRLYEPHPHGVQSFGKDLKKSWETFQQSTQFFKHDREFLCDFIDRKAVLMKPHPNIPGTYSYDRVFSGLLTLVVISTFWDKGALWIFLECHPKVRAHISQPLVFSIHMCHASPF